jgi:hypothetical protein
MRMQYWDLYLLAKLYSEEHEPKVSLAMTYASLVFLPFPQVHESYPGSMQFRLFLPRFLMHPSFVHNKNFKSKKKTYLFKSR